MCWFRDQLVNCYSNAGVRTEAALPYLTRPISFFTGPSRKISLANPRSSFIDFTKSTRPSSEEIPKRAVKTFLNSTPMRYISTAWINPCTPDHSSDDTWFHPKKRDRYTLMFDWMNFLNHSHGCQIQHKLNTGKEKKFGPYPVDGFDQTTNTIYQFHGCHHHAHSCWLTKSIKDKIWLHSKDAKYKKTEKTTRYRHRNVGMSLSTSPTTRSSSSDLRCKQTIYDSTTKNE